MAFKTLSDEELNQSIETSKEYGEIKELISQTKGYLQCLQILIQEFPNHVTTLTTKVGELKPIVADIKGKFFDIQVSTLKKKLKEDFMELTEDAISKLNTATDRVITKFNDETMKTLKSVNQDNKVPLSTMAFYIVLCQVPRPCRIISFLLRNILSTHRTY